MVEEVFGGAGQGGQGGQGDKGDKERVKRGWRVVKRVVAFVVRKGMLPEI